MGRANQHANPSGVELRRGALAVSVLHDLDLEPNQQGIRLTAPPVMFISWNECRRALAGSSPETHEGRERLARWLLARRWAADLPRADMRARLRPVGLPRGHELHPGPEWVVERVLGDALDLGLGAVGLDPAQPEKVVPLPPPALRRARLNPTLAWAEARDYLERMGTVAVARLSLDRRGTLRPLGDCNVATLLGARSMRSALAGSAEGLATIVAPMLRRGWTRLALADPAFAPAAWAATDSAEQGFPRPLLVTREEIVLALDGGRATELLVRERVKEDAWGRDVLYR